MISAASLSDMWIAIALQAASLSCVSPTVSDGRSLSCPGGPPMRLAGIVVPQPNGARRCIDGERPGWSGRCRGPTASEEARDHLRELVHGRRVTCVREGGDADPFASGVQRRDAEGRTLVRCAVGGGGDLSEAMLAGGRAWRMR